VTSTRREVKITVRINSKVDTLRAEGASWLITPMLQEKLKTAVDSSSTYSE